MDSVDASLLNGLGFLLKQMNESGVWHIVQAGSRFLRSLETRYAMIELECLAESWAMKKCRQFLEGLSNFYLVTDHRPLIPILNEYSLKNWITPGYSASGSRWRVTISQPAGYREIETS